jgi:glyoxylase-like metal-dependent hydrolase (beta-lactamase superfamily II)
MRTWIAIAVLSLAVTAAAQQQDFSKVEIKVQKVAGSVYMLTGAGGNIGVSVGEDGIIIVDDQYAPLAEKIRAALKGITDKPVKFVINTHWHGDHTGGNEALGAKGAVIVAHDNVRKRMSVPQFTQLFDRTTPASPVGALPVVTFAESVTLHLNGDDVQVRHVAPAHTDGDALVYFAAANVLHAGDLYFNGFYPFVDASSGGSVRGMILACDVLLQVANDATKIIPGHGPLSNAAELRAYREMLRTVVDRVAALIGQGRTLEQAIAAKPTAEFDAKWGGSSFMPPERFVQVVYADLATSRAPAGRAGQ